MEFFIDVNIILSALISAKGKTFQLIYNDHFKLFASKFLLEKVEKYKKRCRNAHDFWSAQRFVGESVFGEMILTCQRQ